MIKRGWLCGIVSAVLFLAACGMAQAEDYIEQNYAFVDAVANNGSSSDRAMMYRSEQSLADTAAELSQVQEPDQVGEVVEGRQVLVYNDEFVILTEDPDNPGSTLVEVAGEEFVRNTYHPGFFTGMFVGSFLSNRFGPTWVQTQGNRCSRGGCYSGGGSYRSFPSTSTYGRGSTFRGGGPGVGK